MTGVHFVRKGISILNKDYDSEALFNPLTLLLNGGYDITQLQSVSNKIDNPYFGRMLKNVLGNLGDPFSRIRRYGTWKFFRQELLPLGIGADNMQWAPNYQQHLIGCGIQIIKFLNLSLGTFPIKSKCHFRERCFVL